MGINIKILKGGNKVRYSIIAVNVLILMLVNGLMQAQSNPVPNYSFESWRADAPTSWSSSNSDWDGSITQSSDAQDGGSSVKFSQVHEYKHCGNYIAKLTASFPINKRFSSFRFFIKSQKNSGTNCFFYEGGVELYKNGTQIGQANEEADLIGFSSWTERAHNIDYYNSEIPDSAFVIFVMYDTMMNANDYMLIDNVSLFDSSKLLITRPLGGEKWLAGSIDSIMWEGGDSSD